MYLLSVSVTGNGRGGNQPIIAQWSFKNVLPKSFPHFFFCTSLLENLRHMPPSSCLDCPSVLAIAAVWLWRSSVGLVGLVALVSHVPPRHQRRSRPVCAGLSSGLKIFTWFSVPFLFVFSLFCSGEFRGSEFATVFQQDFCLVTELASYPVIVAFWLLPLQSTAFFSEQLPVVGFLRNYLQNLYIHFKKRNWNITVGKVITT